MRESVRLHHKPGTLSMVSTFMGLFQHVDRQRHENNQEHHLQHVEILHDFDKQDVFAD